jgi:hypothetical protein
LATTVCAIALAGCAPSAHDVPPGSGGTANASGIVGAANVDVAPSNAITVNSASHAVDDPVTSVTFTLDTNGTDDHADDTAAVTVKNGGQTAGPTNYAFDPTSHFGSNGIVVGDTGNQNGFYDFHPAGSTGNDNSILVAGETNDTFEGMVAAYSPGKKIGSGTPGANNANVTAFYGGNAPTGPLPTGLVTYNGNAAGVSQMAGGALTPEAGSVRLNANFANGEVDGALLEGTPSGNQVTFSGATMSTDHAGYALVDNTGGGNIIVGTGGGATPATGQVRGGFYGAGYNQTAGIFDVQTGAVGLDPGAVKVTGAFGATH